VQVKKPKDITDNSNDSQLDYSDLKVKDVSLLCNAPVILDAQVDGVLTQRRTTMAFDADYEDGNTSVRKQRRQNEDRKRMAYRRAIEEYRESQALHAQVCDFPDIMEARRPGIWMH
tara:strand:- start:16908 stop:17255 length:348 start_codon:yes stop_codon:yes gene_type:complete